MKKSLPCLILVNVILLSCQKEFKYEPITPITPTNPDVVDVENQKLAAVITRSTSTSYLNGLIVNEQHQPVANATVSCGGKSVTSDNNGFFYFAESLTVNEDYALITVTKSGFMKGFRTFTPNRNIEAYHTEKIILQAAGSSAGVPSSGGEITVDGIKLTFPSNAVVKMDGSAFSGNIKAIARHINPSSANFPLMVPGTLSGLNKAGEIKSLQSFGMANVELQDDAGNKLEIAPGKTIKMEIPAPSNGPASIPLWHFNESFGVWIEQGTALKQGNAYVAEVNHFSIWDIGLEVNDFELNLKFQNSNAAVVANLRVDLYRPGNIFVTTLFTDNAGEATLINCPSNETLAFTVTYPCDTLVYNLAPVTQARSEIITLNSPDLQTYQLNGILYECNNLALPNQAFQLFLTEANNVTMLNGISDAQGHFNLSTILPKCQGGNLSAQTTAYFNNQYFVTKLTATVAGTNAYNPALCNDTTTPPVIGQLFNDSDVVNIPDAGLRQGVRTAINKPAGTIYYKDVKNVESLEIQNGIQSLTGLQFFTGLSELVLHGNLIADLAPLQDLVALKKLSLYGNQIADLSPLQKLTGLTALSLSNNQLTDITALQNLRSLTVLNLSENKISNIGPLQNLTALTALFFDQNQVADISALQNLTAIFHLSLFENKVADISPLQNLSALNYLTLDWNQISDISPLQNLTGLRMLSLGFNPISNITPVQNLTKLQTFGFGPSQVSDISPLRNLVDLIELMLGGNKISDISPLQNLPALDKLYLANNQITTIQPVAGGWLSLTHLEIKSGNAIPANEITAFESAHPNCTVD